MVKLGSGAKKFGKKDVKRSKKAMKRERKRVKVLKGKRNKYNKDGGNFYVDGI